MKKIIEGALKMLKKPKSDDKIVVDGENNNMVIDKDKESALRLSEFSKTNGDHQNGVLQHRH